MVANSKPKQSDAYGTAFASGKWGVNGSGTALGGELGKELVVRDGRFFTIGDNGAEFFNYKPNDIIFNAAQTESLLKYGGIKGAKPRGTTFASGSAFVGGGGGLYDPKYYTSKTGSGSSTGSGETKDGREKVDWIEVLLSRIERQIEKFANRAGNTFEKLGKRITASVNEMTTVDKEINALEKAKKRYQKEYKSIGLDKETAKKVEDGSISIAQYGEKKQKQISEYKEYYEKYLDTIDKIEELTMQRGEIMSERFDMVTASYDNKVSLWQARSDEYSGYIDLAEAQGYYADKSYYENLIKSQKKQKKYFEDQAKDQNAILEEAVKTGSIKEFSEAWYGMTQQIKESEQAARDADIEVANLAKSMRELDWTKFEDAIERMSYISDENDFLIELMSKQKMYDEDGNITKEGTATLGLRLSNMNESYAEAKRYQQEIKKLDKEIAKDTENQDLIKKEKSISTFNVNPFLK